MKFDHFLGQYDLEYLSFSENDSNLYAEYKFNFVLISFRCVSPGQCFIICSKPFQAPWTWIWFHFDPDVLRIHSSYFKVMLNTMSNTVGFLFKLKVKVRVINMTELNCSVLRSSVPKHFWLLHKSVSSSNLFQTLD